MKKKGKLLIIEGGVGCGKTTQIKLLKKVLKGWGFYREPGGTEYGEKVRDVVQGIHNYFVDEYAALFGYSAARSYHELGKKLGRRWKTLDGSKTIGEVHRETLNLLKRLK